jgi:hypothetical protein
MSEFTSGTVRDLRYLYENVVHGEQEVLSEDIKNPFGGSLAGAISRGSTDQGKTQNRAAVGNALGGINSGVANLMKTGGLAGAANRSITAARNAVQGNSSAPASTDYKSPFARGRNAAPGIGNPTGKDSRLDSPIAGKGPRGNEVGSNLSPFKPATTPRTAPGGAGAGSPPNARSMPARPVLSKQGGVEGTGTGANFKAGAWSSADKSRYSAQAAKAPSTSVANAERTRIRGTNQTDNPLMKDFKSSLPAPTSSQSPAVAKLGAGNQSLTTNPSVPKPAAPAATPGVGQRAAAMPSMGSSQYKATTPSAAIAAAPSSSPAASGSVVPATNAIAAAPKPITPNPPGGYSTKEGDGKPRKDVLFSYQYEDAYDLVLEYLLDDGHAATIAEAEYIMTELDSEVINQIVETRLDPRGRPASGPMNVYANPKGKPDQAHLDAVKAYDEKQKKKTPEQRKKELDAYIARQRNK